MHGFPFSSNFVMFSFLQCVYLYLGLIFKGCPQADFRILDLNPLARPAINLRNQMGGLLVILQLVGPGSLLNGQKPRL